jgi:transcription termination/antitermination protein NusG
LVLGIERVEVMAHNWYVLQVYSGHESKVKASIEKLIQQQNLKEKIVQVKVPTMDVAEMKNGKKKVTKKRLIPGYVLIEMEMDDDLQFLVHSLPSVSCFVGKNSKPDPLTLEEVKNLFNEMGDVPAEETQAKPRFLFKVGESLKIIDGPFANFSGVVDEIYPDKGRLRVKVEIFGRSTPVELDFLQVGKL